MEPDEYLTIAEVADRLKLSPKTVKNKMASGIFKKGLQYFKPDGMAPRFKWSAVQAWIESTDCGREETAAIPLKKGVVLKIPLTEMTGRTIRRTNGL